MGKPIRKLFPTVGQDFLNRVKTKPDVEAMFYKEGGQWKGVTWNQHYVDVRNAALGLMELGIKPNDKVSILSNTRYEWKVADIGILGCRGVTVPIYASNTAEEAAYILNHSESQILFIEDNRQLEKILAVRSKIPNVRKFIVFNLTADAKIAKEKDVMSITALQELGARAGQQSRFEDNLMALKPADVFTICYTSGTTGVPKGVVLTYDNIASIFEDVDLFFQEEMGENDVVLSFLPYSHIFGKVESMVAYHIGWKTYFAENIDKLVANMGEVGPTLLFAVPRIFEKAYNRIKGMVNEGSPLKRKLFDWAMKAGRAYYGKIWAGKTPSFSETAEYTVAKKVVFKKVYQRFGGKLRFAVAGGAPLPKEIGEFFQIIGIQVLEGYGLTETTAPVCANPYGQAKFGTIGKPFADVQLKIADDGEILVKSRKVFREYYKNPEATNEVIDDQGWFHTGDIGMIDEDGYVKITDRKKDLIVTSGGKNIAPQKIENLLKTQKYVSQVMVYGDRRHYLTALVTLDKDEVIKFAKNSDILFSTYEDLVRNPKVIALAQQAIDNVNDQLASFETVKKFTVLPGDFTIETGELTPSLKVKRRYCSEKFKRELDSMYKESAYA